MSSLKKQQQLRSTTLHSHDNDHNQSNKIIWDNLIYSSLYFNSRNGERLRETSVIDQLQRTSFARSRLGGTPCPAASERNIHRYLLEGNCNSGIEASNLLRTLIIGTTRHNETTSSCGMAPCHSCCGRKSLPRTHVFEGAPYDG